MNIATEIKTYAKKKGITFKKIAEILNKHSDKKYSVSILSRKLHKDTIKLTELQNILKIMGMQLAFVDIPKKDMRVDEEFFKQLDKKMEKFAYNASLLEPFSKRRKRAKEFHLRTQIF